MYKRLSKIITLLIALVLATAETISAQSHHNHGANERQKTRASLGVKSEEPRVVGAADQNKDGSAPDPHPCGTVIQAEDMAVVEYLNSISAYQVVAVPRHVLAVPVTVHVVRNTNGSGGLSGTDLNTTLADAFAHWTESGIQFFQAGATRFIDNSDFLLNINTLAELDSLRQTDVVAGTINIYFTDHVEIEEGTACGISSFTFNSVQGIVIDNDCTAQAMTDNTSTLAHEIGHYFDLFHTHESCVVLGVPTCEECPDGSNCATAGDQLCDTPADPNLFNNVDINCDYSGSGTRCGDAFIPHTDNLMSYARHTCRTTFTQGQLERALATLTGSRASLTGDLSTVTWLDFSYAGAESGSYAQPFNDLPTAVTATSTGGRIVMKGGSSAWTGSISTSVILDSFNGTATIGL